MIEYIDGEYHGFFVGYKNNFIIDMFTGTVFEITIDSKVFKTNEIWGTECKRAEIRNLIEKDMNLNDDELLPLFAGHNLSGAIIDYNGNSGVWEY